MREQRRDTRLSGGQVDVGDLPVALEIWSLKGEGHSNGTDGET